MIENLAADERPEDRYPECANLVAHCRRFPKQTERFFAACRRDNLTYKQILDRCWSKANEPEWLPEEYRHTALYVWNDLQTPQGRKYLAAKLGLV